MRGPRQQSVASRFFSWYSGSGLVIQCLVRFQLIPNQLSVWRMVSMETARTIQPRRTHYWTSRSSVHRLVSKPKSWGGRCNTVLNISVVTSARRTVGRWWGQLDPACRAISPYWLKAWMAWRTVCSSHDRACAMWGTASPRAEANRIWQRRRTKASEERNPALSDRCTSFVRGRTKIRDFMKLSIPHSGSSSQIGNKQGRCNYHPSNCREDVSKRSSVFSLAETSHEKRLCRSTNILSAH